MFTKWLDWCFRQVFGTPTDGTGQSLTVSASAATSTALTPGDVVRLAATVDCWICFCDSGSDEATDDGSDMILFAGVPEVFSVDDTNKYVSCLEYDANDGGGELSIIPLAGYRVP